MDEFENAGELTGEGPAGGASAAVCEQGPEPVPAPDGAVDVADAAALFANDRLDGDALEPSVVPESGVIPDLAFECDLSFDETCAPVPEALVTSEPDARSSAFVGALGVLALVAVLVPLVLISAYNHSYADDWHYGVWAHLVLEQGGSILDAVVTALQQAGKAWFDWQGTYSAIFLMALEPSVFGEQCYVIAAPLVMAALIAGTLFFTHVLMVELLGCHHGHWLGLSCAMLCVQLLLQPSPVEGIFWFNSAVYYTGYHAAALAMFGCVARIANPARTTRPRGATIAASLLAVFVAGGNFVTALVAAEVLFCVLCVLIYRARRSAMSVLWPFGLLMLGLAISLAAPGNSVRQQTQFPDDSAGVLGTIWGSSLACFQYIQQWSTGLVLLLCVAAAVIAVHAAPKAVERGWRFPLPALVVVGSVALFATSFTPTFWAEGTVGPGRVQNCRFDLFLVLLVLDIFWLCGWFTARRRELDGQPCSQVLNLRQVALAAGLVMLVACCVVGSMAADEDLGEDLSSVSAARSLISGKAAAYDAQVWDRINTIENSDEDSLEVPYYTNVPHVLLMGDIRDNMNNYINYRLCQWYGKESIIGYRANTSTSSNSSNSSSEASASSSSTSSASQGTDE